ncbi:hypothetical protein CYMTET_12434 [Cymbomonas tetramitiformis]|uniref:Uncharacterized protein n=1 Tax=Cymbomonas tetramitiformis TaxID=36881 RepID=A0AAE0LC27_9CHLO|nr:hypothetical protein CYMTET_12434 [Cymbomonas tetramitiformis]
MLGARISSGLVQIVARLQGAAKRATHNGITVEPEHENSPKRMTHSRRPAGPNLTGLGVVMKTVIGEVCDETNQGRGFSYISVGWGLGTALGST